MAKCRTLASEVFADGVTLHAGDRVHMRLAPAEPGTGICFRRSDAPGAEPISALWSNVVETRLGTVLSNAKGLRVGVVEHLLAALAGAQIDDCLVELDGSEPPILDGDALSFLTLLDRAGARETECARKAIRVLTEIKVSSGASSAILLPATAASYHFEID